MKRIVMCVAVIVMAVILSGCCMFGGKCGCKGEKKPTSCRKSVPTEKAK